MTRFIDVIKEVFGFSRKKDELHYHVLQLKPHVQQLVLTEAEEQLLRYGIEDGYLEFDRNENEESGTRVIRSEILEWVLTLPESYRYLFRKNGLHLQNAVIKRMAQYVGLSEKTNQSQFVLQIPKQQIPLYLTFENCRFKGGIDISDCELGNLEFIQCLFGKGSGKESTLGGHHLSSIFGERTFIKSLKISNNHHHLNQNI